VHRVDRFGFRVALLLLLLAGCGRETGITVTGRVADAATGAPLPGARVVCRREPGAPPPMATVSGPQGWYAVAELRPGDTLRVDAERYRPVSFIVPRAAPGTLRQDFYLTAMPDTAWTAAGPMDASFFLDNSGLKRKKLSVNEARIMLTEKFPGVRVYNGSLVSVSDHEEWLFELRFGRSSASAYMDAYTGEIRSIESDDPNLDRKLQDQVGR
jgi:hypothetical protein